MMGEHLPKQILFYDLDFGDLFKFSLNGQEPDVPFQKVDHPDWQCESFPERDIQLNVQDKELVYKLRNKAKYNPTSGRLI